jgi:hypothetical protein
VRVGDGVGDLHRNFNRPPHVYRTAGHLRAKRLPLGELEDEVDAAVMFPDIEHGDDVRVGQADDAARLLDQSCRIRGEVRRQDADRDGPSEAGVARAIQVAGSGLLEPLQKIVVSDDAERRRRAHGPGSSSMTLCTSSFASPICSSTMAISIVGRPGVRALWQ